MTEFWHIRHDLKDMLEHIQNKQIARRLIHEQDRSTQFVLSVCDSIVGTIRRHFDTISADDIDMTRFADFLYTPHDLICFDANHPQSAGLTLNSSHDLTLTQVENFLGRPNVGQCNRKAIIAYGQHLYHYDQRRRVLVKINPRSSLDWDSRHRLIARIQQQPPFTISKTNEGVRRDISNLTVSDYHEREYEKNVDFDTLKRLVTSVRGVLISEKNKFHIWKKRGIIGGVLGLMGTLSIGLILYYWPIVLTYLALNSVVANVLFSGLQCLSVPFVYLILGGLLFTATGHSKENEMDGVLMALNHPPALTPCDMDLNEFFSVYQHNLMTIFAQRRQDEVVVADVAEDLQSESDNEIVYAVAVCM